MSSLKCGVAKEIILAELQRKENRISTGPNRRREAKNIDIDNYCHIINKEETKGFFDSMKNLYEMTLKYASSDSSRRSSNYNNRALKESNVNVRSSNDSEMGMLSKEHHEGKFCKNI